MASSVPCTHVSKQTGPYKTFSKGLPCRAAHILCSQCIRPAARHRTWKQAEQQCLLQITAYQLLPWPDRLKKVTPEILKLSLWGSQKAGEISEQMFDDLFPRNNCHAGPGSDESTGNMAHWCLGCCPRAGKSLHRVGSESVFVPCTICGGRGRPTSKPSV